MAWTGLCCDCCMSGRSLCDELITCPEKSYQLWCVVSSEQGPMVVSRNNLPNFPGSVSAEKLTTPGGTASSASSTSRHVELLNNKLRILVTHTPLRSRQPTSLPTFSLQPVPRSGSQFQSRTISSQSRSAYRYLPTPESDTRTRIVQEVAASRRLLLNA